MTREGSWKPGAETMAQWPHSEWEHRYFLWLQGPKPLPVLPEGYTVEEQHRGMFQVLVCLHGFDERRRKDALDGKFDDLDEAEAYDYSVEDNRLSESEKEAEYRALLARWLNSRFAPSEVTNGLIDQFIAEMDAVRPYRGPRA